MALGFSSIARLFVIVAVSLCCFNLVVKVNAENNGLGLTPPMGWTTWCTDAGFIPCIDDYCQEDEIKSVADAMISNGMAKLGYNLIHLDDCWAGPRTENGTITAETSRFPTGSLKELADYLHSLDPPMKLGIYTDVGNFTCKHNRPGSWGHYRQDSDTYAQWGIDYVKMDWCDHPDDYDAETLYGMMSKALNGSGHPMFFAMCGWGLDQVWTWGAQVANSWRVGPDHLPVWWTPPTDQDPGQGQGTANIIQHMANITSYTGPGGWNDPDFLMTGLATEGLFGLDETDWTTEFSFWSIFPAPLIVATDVRKMSDKADILLNAEAIAVNQDPLGAPAVRYSKTSDGGEVWSKPLSTGQWAVLLYNSNLLPLFTAEVQFSFNSTYLLGWTSNSTSADVRDLWLHEDLGTFDTEFTAVIDSHAVRYLLVTPTGY